MQPNPTLALLNGMMPGAQPWYQSISSQTPQQPVDPVYARNMQWARPSPNGYLTQLSPQDEPKFQQWVQQNKVPFDPSPNADYDMRGFYQDLMSGGGHAQTGMNANDGQLHFNDYFKTPYHMSFSNESRWALPNAPQWNDKDQLIDSKGNVVFDEPAYVKQQRQDDER